MSRFKDLYKRAHSSRFIRIAFFGGVGVIVQSIVFECLGPLAGILRPSLATVVGAEFGLITNFFLNNHFSFTDRTHSSYLVRLFRFHLVVSGSIFIQWLCVFIAESLNANWWLLHVAYVTGILVGFISNYIWYHVWVWREHRTQA